MQSPARFSSGTSAWEAWLPAGWAVYSRPSMLILGDGKPQLTPQPLTPHPPHPRRLRDFQEDASAAVHTMQAVLAAAGPMVSAWALGCGPGCVGWGTAGGPDAGLCANAAPHQQQPTEEYHGVLSARWSHSNSVCSHTVQPDLCPWVSTRGRTLGPVEHTPGCPGVDPTTCDCPG